MEIFGYCLKMNMVFMYKKNLFLFMEVTSDFYIKGLIPHHRPFISFENVGEAEKYFKENLSSDKDKWLNDIIKNF
jgi:hypothetical protein